MARYASLLLLAACPGDGDQDDGAYDSAPPSCWCVPVVASVSILPGSVIVQPVGDGARTFEMHARLKDAGGHEIAEFFGYLPQWQADPASDLIVRERDGHRAVFELVGTPAGPIRVTVEAVPGVSNTAEITVFSGATGAGQDYVAVDHVSGRPSIVLVENVGATDSWGDATPVVFVGGAPVGNNNGATGVMLFTFDRALLYESVAFTPAQDEVTYKAAPGPPPAGINQAAVVASPGTPLSIPITLWIDQSAPSDGWTATTLEALARVQVAVASRIFERNRAGIRFHVAGVYVYNTPVDNECVDPHATLTGVSPVAPYPVKTFDRRDVNVFFTEFGLQSGYSCVDLQTPGQEYFRAFVNARLSFPTTLAHEMAHILVSWYHSDATLGRANILADGELEPRAPLRYRVSLGQACKANLSVLLVPLRPAGVNGPPRCPPLARDF